ncbi:hypothetical protein [Flaviaesturariibacter amylovorans]|uniref:Phage tail tape measure protein n=1 Tax=Flaviaesturariibacter amylovorans TaxID=1084520 RepID=A0ABP8GQV3_9BACT
MGNVNVNGAPLEFTAAIDDKGFNASLQKLEQGIEASVRRQIEANKEAEKAQAEYSRMIVSTGQAFKALDAGVQGQIKQLTSLQSELAKVKEAQDLLSERKELGLIGTDTANSSMAALVARERELSAAIGQVSKQMETSDAIMRAATGSLLEKSLQLANLKEQYVALSEADRNNADIGGKLLTNIQALDEEVRAVNAGMQSVQKNALGSINARLEALSKLKEEYSALSETDRNSSVGRGMLANIQQIDAEVRTLNGSFQAIAANAAGSLNEKMATLSRLKNEYAALAAVDRDSDIGKALRENIQGVEQEVQKINGAFGDTNSLVSDAVAAIAAYASLASMGSFLSDVIAVRGEFQKLEAVLTNSLGSKGAAQESLQMISEYVARTPFELKEVADSYVKLVNQGFKPTRDEIASIGDLAASTGKQFDQLAEAIIDAQTGEFERLKEFGVRASKEGDRITFTFRDQKTVVEDSNEAIRNYLVSLGKVEGVAGATAAISATLEGQISNLRDAWTRMLNDVGQSGEGVFSTAIAAATSLVENYRTVVDILKTLVLSYGAYRAAMIANSVITVQYSVATRGLSIAQTLQATATTISKRAMDALNLSMKANPAGLVAAAVAGLISYLVFFKDSATEARQAQDLLNDAQSDASAKFAEQEGAIRGYVEELKNQNLSEQARLDAYTKLKNIAPDIIGQLTFQAAKTTDLTDATNVYIASLRQRLDLEANQEAYKAARKQREDAFALAEAARKRQGGSNQESTTRVQGAAATVVSELTEYGQAVKAFREADRVVLDVERKIKSSVENTEQAITDRIAVLQKEQAMFGTNSERYKEYAAQITSLNNQLAKLRSGKKEDAPARTLEVIDKEIKAEKEKQQQFSASSAQYKAYQETIAKLEAERERIVGKSKTQQKAQQTEENKANAALEKRTKLLEDIAGWQREADRTGMVKEASEMDKVNAKWDERLSLVAEYNEYIRKFNKEHKTNLPLIGQDILKKINDARTQEVGNVGFKEDAEKYKTHLDEMKSVFEKYEEAKKQIGSVKAAELYREQIQGFESYEQFLMMEFAKLQPKIKAGVANIAEQLKFEDVVKKLTAIGTQSAEQQINNIVRVVTATATAATRRQQIEDKYAKDLAILQANYAGEEFEQRKKLLDQARQDELDAVQDSVNKQSEAYKQLNKDITFYSREAIRGQIDAIKRLLTGKDLSPVMRKQLEAQRDSLQEIYDQSKISPEAREAAKEFGKMADKLGQVSGIMSGLSGIAANFDGELASVLDTMSQMASVGQDVFTAVSQFASGNILGGVTSVIGGIGKALGIGRAAREEERRREQEARQFQFDMFLGAQDLLELERERTREAVKRGKLTIDALNAEKALLQQQRVAAQQQFAFLLGELQKHTGKSTKRVDFGFGIVRSFIEDFSLAGKSYEELEQLFVRGQLQDNARALFEQLQELKQEGVDIDRMLEENKRQAMELFTGTTETSIADTIISGFQNGLSGAADFASSFEDMMKQAILNSLKFKYLEGPLKDFYAEFAAASESDGQLTSAEIAALQGMYNDIINGASQQFQSLQQLTGLNFSGAGAAARTLTGEVKNLTEETGSILAGRIGAIQMMMNEMLGMHRAAQGNLNDIVANTGNTVIELRRLNQRFDRYETGQSKINVIA